MAPRVVEGVETVLQDERAEVVMEPGQEVDLLAHWKAVPLTKRWTEPALNRVFYAYEGDGAIAIMKVATTSPDVFVEFRSHNFPSYVVGGPWATQIVETSWVVRVRDQFWCVAQNRSKETVRERVYFQVALRRRHGW